jgi:hypothetical protein
MSSISSETRIPPEGDICEALTIRDAIVPGGKIGKLTLAFKDSVTLILLIPIVVGSWIVN